MDSNNKINWITVVFFSLALLIFPLCMKAAPATTISKPNSKPAKLVVLLDWFANPDHAPLFVAKQQGFFQQQGLDVSLVAPADPSDPTKLVAVGKADIAISYQPKLLIAQQQGLPLVRIGTLVDSPLTCLVVNGNSKINTISDLKGKTVGYSEPEFDLAALDGMLKYNHLSIKDVTPVDVHFNLTQALLSRRVDAVIGMMRNFELIELQELKQPGRAFYPEKNGFPSYDELIFVANKNEAQDPRIAKFMRAITEGVAYLKQHPEQCWQEFAKEHPELNNSLNKKSWFATLPYFANQPVKLDSKRYQEFSRYMQGLQ